MVSSSQQSLGCLGQEFKSERWLRPDSAPGLASGGSLIDWASKGAGQLRAYILGELLGLAGCKAAQLRLARVGPSVFVSQQLVGKCF